MPPPKYTSLPSEVGAVQPMAGTTIHVYGTFRFFPTQCGKVHAAIRHESLQGEIGAATDAGGTGGIGDRRHGAAGIGGHRPCQAFLIGADADELIAVSGECR